MHKTWMTITRTALALGALAVAGSVYAQADLLGQTDGSQPALHRAGGLNWVAGEGAFAGGEVAVLGRDAKTGVTALMVKMPVRALGKDSHIHPVVAHTLLLSGQLRSEIDGQTIEMAAGDYYRSNGGGTHASTQVQQEARMFMLTEGDFETLAVAPSVSGSTKANEANLLWNEPAKVSFARLHWEDGTGDMAGMRVALVGTDPATGRSAFYVQIPQRKLGEEQHFHTAIAHTIVIDGQITTSVNGEEITLGPGDYFRSTPTLPHLATQIESQKATLFMITEGRFDTRLAASK